MSVILTDKIQPRTTGIAITVVGDMDVTGAVSVAGTITYEDVTNVDSVGLITARTGVRVTAGGVVVTAGVSTFTDDVKVNSTLTATEGINVTAGVTTIAGDLLIADQIIHSGDSNTSIRFPAADQVKITTAGGSRLHITENGKIGVGGDPTGYPGKFMVIGAAGGASGILCDREIISRVASGIANTERGFQQLIDGVEKLACFADNSGNFNLNNNNGKNRITVTEAGKVGLGTVNPQLNLHVHAESSNASFGHYTNTTTGVSGSDGVSIGLDSDENAVIYNYESTAVRFATGGSEKARITSDGELLVALTSGSGSATDARLQVRGDSHTKSKIQVLGTHNDDNPASLVIAKSRGSGNVILGDNDDIGQVDFAGNDGNGYHIIARIAVSSSGQGNGDNDLPTVMRFFTTANGGVTNSERMRLDSSGRLLIGAISVSPANSYSDNLVVSEASGDAGISIHGNNSNSNYASLYLGDAGGANRAYLEAQLGSNGNFTIGASGASPIRFLTNGSERARITSDGQLQATSAADVRLTLGSSGTAGTNDSVHIRADSANLNFMAASGGVTKFEVNGTQTFQIASTGRIQYYSSAGSFTSFRESFKSGAISNGGTFTAQTHNCHACGTVTITSNLDGSSNNKRCVQFPISLNSTSNANLGSSLFTIDGSSGQNFSVAGASKGVTVTNSSGNTVHITVTFDITGSV